MSADSYGSIWRKVRLYCPLAPPLLVQDWVKNASRMFSDESNWSFLRSESEFSIDASKQGGVTLTHGSAIAPSTGGASGMVFASSDVGRQIRFPGQGPPITIAAVDTTGNTSATLERQWLGTTGDATVTISDLYALCPADFGHFIAVLDPQMKRRIRIFSTEHELNAADPGRANTGDPWALVSYRLSQLPSTLGRALYEWYPYWEAQATRRYPFYYIRRPSDLGDDDYFLGPLRDRSDVILEGALSQAAEWPGTTEQKNPYFNLQLAARKRAHFEFEMGKLEVRDQELFLTWFMNEPWQGWSAGFGPLTPSDAAFLQSHEG